MRHVLVVANKTLNEDALLEAVRKKLESEPCEFWVLVPATPVRDNQAPVERGRFHPDGSDEASEAWEMAQRRLEHGIERLRGLGAPVDGEVGDADPMHAITEVVSHRPVDEVLISTLPAHASHWLHTDLPSRVHRKHHLPVTTVTHDPVPARV
jgi:hypothetical protein